MQVKYKGNSYELTLFHAFGFHLKRAWFPLRRFGRAVKRTIYSLGSWISTLAVFVPICIIVFWVLLNKKVIGLNASIIELVSIILGSFLLLAIKEIRDSEAHRRTVLRKQWEYYDSWRYEFVYALKDFLQHLGLKIADYSFLNSLEEWEASFHDSAGVVPSPECLEDDIKVITDCIALVIKTARDEGFVDWDVELANERAKRIEQLANGLARDVRSGETVLDDADNLGKCATALLALVRRPWRYRNDMAHMELIERHLDQYGARIKQ